MNHFKMSMSHYYILQHMKYPCQHCGHKIVILPSKETGICDWCGYKVFKTDPEWFNYNLLNAIKKGKHEKVK